MATKTHVILTCDLEQGEKPGTQTIGFAFDGVSYEVDVCDRHAKQLRDAFGPYVSAGRRASSGRGAGRRSSRGSGDRQRTQEIRAWARKKGIKVSERGRLSSDIVAQYEAAGGK